MKFSIKQIANPYFIFALIWAAALLIYLLGWSEIFPPISASLFIFISCGILFHFLFGIVSSKLKLITYRPFHGLLAVRVLVILNIFLWIVEFAYSKVPLIEILRGSDYEYQNFGIPTVKVFITSFNAFLCLYIYHIYLTYKQKKYLWYYLLCLSFFVIAFARGMIMITLASTLFLWILAKGNVINLKKVFLFISVFLTIIYVFGVAGNVRTAQLAAIDNHNVGGFKYDDQLILTIGSASESFKSNVVPNEFFWTYLYIASPISNLQYNIDRNNFQPLSVKSFLTFGVNELTFDFISKRVDSIFHVEPAKPDLVVEVLTVYTTFARSYCTFGWPGLMIMLLFMLFFPLFYLLIIGKNSAYAPVAIAIMVSVYFFSFFDNMFVFSGLGAQLIYPLLFEFLFSRPGYLINSKHLQAAL